MNVFYKGEDISLTMGLFVDGAMEVPISMDDYVVDLVVYSNGHDYVIHCSLDELSDVQITKISNNTLKVILPKDFINKLIFGQVMIEIRLQSKTDLLSRIVKGYAFSLEESKIRLIPCSLI